MAPNGMSVPRTGVVFATGTERDVVEATEKSCDKNYKFQICWRNVILLVYFHINAFYGAYLMYTAATWGTVALAFFLYVASSIGASAGGHRLYSHRAFKVKQPLHVLLVFLQLLAYQGSVYRWASDHRVHHKYSETDADPYNSTRGFFFSHVGWALVRKHPSVAICGKKIDVSDLTSDPVIMFQHKYYLYLQAIFNCAVPTFIPMFFWNEAFSVAFNVNFTRYLFTLHMWFLINSAAHMWGNRPYDKTIAPTENLLVTLGTLGEGHHNFHHAFPWDYRQYELKADFLNFSTAFIDFFAWVGWAYDLKVVSADMVKARTKRTGDGSHEVWGWGDPDMKDSDKVIVKNIKT